MDKSKRRITVTLDTGCINAKGKNQSLNEVEKLVNNGLIEIYKTDDMDTELEKGYKSGLAKSKNLKKDLGVGVWGVSKWGESIWGSKKDSEELMQIAKILFPNKKYNDLNKNELIDCKMLHTHYKYNRDYFLSLNTKHIINRKDELKKVYNINVFTPEEFYRDVISKIT